MRFYSLEKLINMDEGYRKAFKIDHYNLLLIQVGGVRYLLESQCPHKAHPLTESDIDGGIIQCPLHNYQFNIANGELVNFTEEPCRSLKMYELVYQGNEVGILL